ncbi:MAG: hypothetical protein A2340_02605, partial [Lentisphaerae bacterium RIFOXYB12_FULL_60_10]
SDTTEGTADRTGLTFTSVNWNGLQTVTVTGVDDVQVDGNIVYSIVLGIASSTDGNYNGKNPADVTVTNVDNDTAGFTVSGINGDTSEGGSFATFTVRLTSQPTNDVSFTVGTSDTTEGTADRTGLTFTSSNWNGLQTVTVTGVDDVQVDGNILYSIVLGIASSTDGNYTGKNPADVTVTNVDNDTAGFTVSAISGNTNESGGFATFTVRLTSQPTNDVSFAVASSDTTEGTVDRSGLTFTSSNWNGLQTVTVTGMDDPSVDGNIVYSIVLGIASSSDGNYNGRNPADVTVTNVDNDTAGFTVSGISGDTNEGGGFATFTVRLTSQPTNDVSFTVGTSDTTEGTADVTGLTFTSSNWNGLQTVTVTGVDDVQVDGNIVYSIALGIASSTDGNYNGKNPADVTVTNVDNDTAGFTVGAISGDTNEGGGFATFTVRLTSQPTNDVSFTVATSDTTEGTADRTGLTFTSVNWNGLQTVTVTGVNDVQVDGNIVYSIALGIASSTDGNYNGKNPADVTVTNVDNDTAGFTVSAISGNTSESGGFATFTVRLTSQPTNDVSFSVGTSDTTEGTADVTGLTFTSSNWNGLQTVTVTGVDDVQVDGNIVYSIVLGIASSTDGNYNGKNPADVTVTNVDNDTAGFTVSAISGDTNEGGGFATFTVRLTSQPTNDVSFTVATSDTTEGTADRTGLTFTSSNWNGLQTVTVTGVDDVQVDGDIVYSIVLGVASSSDGNYTGKNPADVTVTNVDNDTAGFTVSAISGNTSESGSSATFTVRLTSQPTHDVSFSVGTSDTTEGTADVTGLTFTSVNWNGLQTVTVTGVDDVQVDGSIVYSIALGIASSTDGNYNGKNPADVTVTNIDNDTAGFTVGAISGDTNEGGGFATFTVRLTSQPTSDVSFAVSTSDTTEGSPDKANLTFTSSNWNGLQTVTVTGVDDVQVDGNIVYNIVLGVAVSGDGNYNGKNPADVELTNVDNDTAGFTVSAISGNTSESGGFATFTVRLTSQPTNDVSFTVGTSDTTEGTANVMGLTFTSVNWNGLQTVTVTGVDDVQVDGNIVYSIVLGNASSSDGNYTGKNPADVTVTNVDNDTAGFTVSAISGDTSESGGSATFTVRLTSQPTNEVSFAVSTSDTTEGTPNASGLTFTAGNWNTDQTVTVTGVDDPQVDGDISFNIVLGLASSADGNYTGKNPADVSVTNTDDDVAVFTVSGISGATTEVGGTATFTVQLASQPTADVSVPISSGDTTEGTPNVSGLTFTGGNWNSPQTLTVTGVDDFMVDGNVGYTIVLGTTTSGDPNYNNQDPSDVAVVNNDNDVAGFTVSAISGHTTEGGGTATFTVRLSSQPTHDVSFALSSSDTTEGTPNVSGLTFTSGNWNTVQTVTVTGVNDFQIDGNVVFTIALGTATSSDGNYNTKDPSDVSVTNDDNDVASFTVGAISGHTTESGGTATFTVQLTSQPTQSVSIPVSTSDTTEGTPNVAGLTFTTSSWNAPQTVTVTGVDDALIDGNVVYTIVLAAASSSDTNYNNQNPNDVSVTNDDNDVAGVTVGSISGHTTEGGGTATFTVQLDTQPTNNVSIPVSSNDTTEGTPNVSGLTFTSGNWNTPQTVTVTGVNDFQIDGPVVYSIVLAAATSSDGNYSGFNPADVAVTNDDNDVAGISVGAISGHTTEGAGTATFTVQLDTQPANNVSFAVSSTDTTEGTPNVAGLTFTSGNWNTAQTVTVTGVNDFLIDGDVGYTIVLAAATSSDGNYSGLDPDDVSVINDDNDVAGFAVGAISGHTTESGGTATFTVRLLTQPTDNVNIPVSSNDTTEGTPNVSGLTFTSG